jgi:hypothetical protein
LLPLVGQRRAVVAPQAAGCPRISGGLIGSDEQEEDHVVEMSRFEPDGPPGLDAGDISGLLPQLPNHRGALRIAGYYQLGRQIMVVFDVFDDQDNRVTAIRTAYPAGLPYLAPGTPYPVG